MNYNKAYTQLVDKARSRSLENCYVEHHHIIPKSEGGDDDESNIVNLTAREHYIAHLLLAKIYDDFKMYAAVIFMQTGAHKRRKFKFNSHLYEKLRHSFSIKSRGRHHSKETKKKMSQALSGRTFSEETKKKISQANRGKKHSEETKKKISEISKTTSPGRHWWNNGEKDVFCRECPSGWTAGRLSSTGCFNGMYRRKHSEESRNKMSCSRKGKHFSEEWRRSISIERTGKHWYTDGNTNRFTRQCPEGFVKGRTSHR